MSEQDSFINEVSEEVRKDRLYKLIRRYGWIAVLLVVVLVGGAAFNEWRKASARAEAQAAGDAVLAALQADDPAGRATALSELAVTDDPGQRALYRLLAASAEIEAGNSEGATALLDALADDGDAPRIYRDLATLKSVILSSDTAPETRIARLDPLAVPNAPFRLLALEQIAVAQVDAGDTGAALDTLRGILGERGVTQGLRGRVQQLIVALGGSLSAI